MMTGIQELVLCGRKIPDTPKDHVDVGVSLISSAHNFYTTQLSAERSQHLYLVATKISLVLPALREQLQQSAKRPLGEVSQMDHYQNVPSVSLPVSKAAPIRCEFQQWTLWKNAQLCWCCVYFVQTSGYLRDTFWWSFCQGRTNCFSEQKKDKSIVQYRSSICFFCWWRFGTFKTVMVYTAKVFPCRLVFDVLLQSIIGNPSLFFHNL